MTIAEIEKMKIAMDYDALLENAIETVSDIDTTYGKQSYAVVLVDEGGYALLQTSANFHNYPRIPDEYLYKPLSKTRFLKEVRFFLSNCKNFIPLRVEAGAVDSSGVKDYKKYTRELLERLKKLMVEKTKALV